MGIINGSLASAISQVAAGKISAAQSASSGSGSSFGSATNVTLSAPAQAALSGSAPAAPPASGGGGGGIPIATSSSSTTDSTLLVAIAKAQVIPKVGVTGASLVVDSKGDIDQVKLNELIAQQAEKAAAEKSST